ncbi:conserved exported hypothetical protein [Frankia canadensis]|uniref:YncI copper-binding domain-containing protein n=1 Tax=Frankia canadensis TaxID=1836972 RepID=A0A2I2L079_9ACTN|nr:YcnI family protein [Frankia canadensis]SNQ51297.1 conserved exported hypothetical protein [Frankia canadensis]SOU58587.1 conserved exported hypothetical protein [Frankia canadensis]
MHRSVWRAGVLAGAAAAVTALLTGPACAHVSVQPSTAAPGSYTTLTFKVPTEKDDASTTGLDVQLPTDAPLASVSVQPKAGWTYQVARAAPATPLRTDDGEVREVVTRITWTAPNGGGIRPGEFDTFTISAGPLPEKVDHLAFKALQTYSDGSVVRWVDVATAGGPEPEHPAPAITLTSATAGSGGQATAADASPGVTARAAGTADADHSDGAARGLGIGGLVLGALGLVVGGAALLATRRRRAQP